MSRLLVTYEWEWVVFDKEDIVHADYAHPGELCPVSDMTIHALVKNSGNDQRGLVDRTWAYVEDGILSATFEDGTKVPRKLADEFSRVMGVET